MSWVSGLKKCSAPRVGSSAIRRSISGRGLSLTIARMYSAQSTSSGARLTPPFPMQTSETSSGFLCRI